MRWLTKRIPTSVKRRVPIVRERDALRAHVGELQARLGSREPPPVPPAGGVHGTYAGNGRMLISTRWGGRLFVPSDDLSLMPELVARGTYDEPFTKFVQRHIQPGDTVIDAGAHVGLFTLLLGYQVWEHGHVIAYEPNPRTLELLRDNVVLNWLSDRVEIVPKAAGAASASAPFLAAGRFTMSSSLRPVEDQLSSEDRHERLEKVDVEVEPLDVHAGRFSRIDLIKVDVEGAEEQVFAGMARLLASGAVKRVTFEVSRDLMGDEWEPFNDRLRHLEGDGWGFFTISEAGLPEPLSLTAMHERGRYSQVLMQRGTAQDA